MAMWSSSLNNVFYYNKQIQIKIDFVLNQTILKAASKCQRLLTFACSVRLWISNKMIA